MHYLKKTQINLNFFQFFTKFSAAICLNTASPKLSNWKINSKLNMLAMCKYNHDENSFSYSTSIYIKVATVLFFFSHYKLLCFYKPYILICHICHANKTKLKLNK